MWYVLLYWQQVTNLIIVLRNVVTKQVAFLYSTLIQHSTLATRGAAIVRMTLAVTASRRSYYVSSLDTCSPDGNASKDGGYTDIDHHFSACHILRK